MNKNVWTRRAEIVLCVCVCVRLCTHCMPLTAGDGLVCYHLKSLNTEITADVEYQQIKTKYGS